MSEYAKLYGEAREAAAYVKVFAKSDAAEVHVERLIRAHKEQADAIEALEARADRAENHKDVLATALQQSEEARIAVMRERDAAVADNAALLEYAQWCCGWLPCECTGVGDACVACDRSRVLLGDHPGAALLARKARLEAASEMAMKIPPATGVPVAFVNGFNTARGLFLDALDAAESETSDAVR